MTIRRTDLPNGLTVVSDTIPGARSAAFACWVRVGSRDEPEELAGASHFLEHLLFRGSAGRSGREISEAIEAVGGDMNAHTGVESTAFHTRVPASASDLGLELLVDVMTAPTFDADDVESERSVIREELHQADDAGDDRVHVLSQEVLWAGHPIGREVLGTAETIESLDVGSIRRFFEERYHPSEMFLVGAGAVDHDDLTTAGRRFDTRPPSRPRRRESPPPHEGARTAVIERPLEQAHLAIAWRALPGSDPDHPAQVVLSQILGGGLSSRFFQEIREQRGLAYSVHSSVTGFTDAGTLIAYAGSGADRIAEVRGLITRIVEDIVTDGVGDRELEVARGYLEGATLLGLEDTGAVAARLGHRLCAYGEIVPVEEQLDRLRAVTTEDLRRTARRILGADPVTVAVGPVREDQLVG